MPPPEFPLARARLVREIRVLPSSANGREQIASAGNSYFERGRGFRNAPRHVDAKRRSRVIRPEGSRTAVTKPTKGTHLVETSVQVTAGERTLPGILAVPAGARGLVLFAHGSGSSRLSPRNTLVARALQQAGLGTLLFDLLIESEDTVYETRFDIELLAERMTGATEWARTDERTRFLRPGFFGASTGAAAALRAAAAIGEDVFAVVSRGGRPDLTGPAIGEVRSPTLLIVGGLDTTVVELNRQAYAQLRAEKELLIVPGATHLFEEPGTLEEVTRLARDWFVRHLESAGASS